MTWWLVRLVGATIVLALSFVASRAKAGSLPDLAGPDLATISGGCAVVDDGIPSLGAVAAIVLLALAALARARRESPSAVSRGSSARRS
jgi:hypothetical protein